MDHEPRLPDGLRLARTTPTWDQESLPDGLLRAHQIADGVWGRLVVTSGSIDFAFEDDGSVTSIGAGEAQVIPPGRPHHVTVTGPVQFCVEFHTAREPHTAS